ncbi:hypothetical protein [Phaeodactylibacter xiamenensis]|jgi:LDH2 family malate/lactate/ureidoglycolate dehydrogenase|uniref:hypothetical protein n=1 Tax=Phaeodactylibacter xiamenensis TaxID=1524460 RepID=UPI003CCBA666
MDPRQILKDQFLQIVDTQLKTNDPAHTRVTFDRLRAAGYNDETARLMIAQCVAAEVREVMSSGAEFNTARYIKNLDRLPEPPESVA